MMWPMGKPANRKWMIPALTAVCWALTALLTVLCRFPVRSVTVTEFGSADASALSVSFPHTGDSEPGRVFIYRMTVEKGVFSPAWVRIIPDDELLSVKANGETLPLHRIRPGALTDWNYGFSYPLTKFLGPGAHTVEIEIKNNGGKYGLSVLPTVRDPLTAWIGFLSGLSVLLAAYLLLRHYRTGFPESAVILGALAVRLLYLSVTPWSMRGHDAAGHLDYVDYLIRNFASPSSREGFEFYHPPLYYVLAAVPTGLLQLAGAGRAFALSVLQFLSLGLNMVFVAVSLATLRDWIGALGSERQNPRLLRLRPGGWSRAVGSGKSVPVSLILAVAGALFAFWPSGIIHSVRIGNDALLYPLFALGVFFLQRWVRQGNDRELIRAALMAALAVLTKTNGVVLAALMAAVVLTRWLADPGRFRVGEIRAWFRRILVSGVICLAGLTVAHAPRVVEAARGENRNLLVANVSTLHSGLRVGNNISNYIWFDARQFVTVPFTSPWDDGKGRQLFWNYLLKTALFGEFSYDSPFLRNLGVLISLVFLALTLYAAAFPFVIGRRDLRLGRVLFADFFLLFSAAVVFRILIPYASSNDFRYILPVLCPAAALYGYAIYGFARRGMKSMVRAGIGLAAVFLVLVVLFFAGLFAYHAVS